MSWNQQLTTNIDNIQIPTSNCANNKELSEDRKIRLLFGKTSALANMMNSYSLLAESNCTLLSTGMRTCNVQTIHKQILVSSGPMQHETLNSEAVAIAIRYNRQTQTRC